MTDKITVDRALLQRMVDAVDLLTPTLPGLRDSGNRWLRNEIIESVDALRAALAQPAVEPVAWLYDFTIVGDNEVYTNWVTQDPTEVGKEVEGISNVRPLYTSPPPPAQPVAHAFVQPLQPDESQRKVVVKWTGQPVFGPLYTSPPCAPGERTATGTCSGSPRKTTNSKPGWMCGSADAGDGLPQMDEAGHC